MLCELELELSEHPDLTVPVFSGEIAQKLGRKDGRAVTRQLMRMEEAGLVARVGLASPMWRPTGKGRQVDGLLASINHRRGGRFRPWAEIPELRAVEMRLALK